MYVLDSDILTAALFKHPVVMSRLAKHSPETVWTSVVAIEEVMGGAIEGVNKARTRKGNVLAAYDFLYKLSDQIKFFQVLPYTATAHRIYEGFTAAELRRGKNDCRLASIALASHFVVVSRNTRDFEGLVAVENWMD